MKKISSKKKPAPVNPSARQLQDIYAAVLSTAGIDLRNYKSATIHRRITRRMASLGIRRPERYAVLLKRKKAEAKALAAECMVRVTSFYRDPRAFATLCKRVFTPLMKRRDPGDPIRIWVPGCATGEEAYTLIFELIDCLAPVSHVPIQVFGTDVDEEALAIARRGLYPTTIESSVPRAILGKYFSRAAGGYEVSKFIRNLCTFARQDLTADPPFSRLDLISCRNVLIYIDGAAQTRILSNFHYGLKADGHLFLGRSEAVDASFPNLFTAVDKRASLYRRRNSAVHPPLFVANNGPAAAFHPPQTRSAPTPAAGDQDREIDRQLLAALQPSMMLLNETLDVVQTRGDMARYLRFPSGRTSLNLMKIGCEEIIADVKEAVERSRRQRQPVRRRLHLRDGRRVIAVDIDVRQVPRPGNGDRLSMVLFSPSTAAAPASGRSVPEKRLSATERRRLRTAQTELATTRDYLASIVEENERSKQELRSANEEILSANEELQSTNEELETAKEELESTNEELTTLNEELERRNVELGRSLDELNASRDELSEAQAIANLGSWTWMLGADTVQWSDEMFRIYGLPQNAAPVTFEQFLASVHPEDRSHVKNHIARAQASGKPFSFVHRIVRADGLVRTLQARGEIVRDGRGKAVRMHGTAQDITDVKEVEEKLRSSEQRFRLLVDAVTEYAIFLLDLDGKVRTWNSGAQRLKQYEASEVIGRHFSVFYDEADRQAGLPEKLLGAALRDGRAVAEGWRVRKDGSRFWASVVITALRDEHGKPVGFSKITRDMSERKAALEALEAARVDLERRVDERTRQIRENEERLRRTNLELEQFAYVASHDLQEPLRKVSNNSDLLVRKLGDAVTPEAKRHLDNIVASILRMHRLINDLLDYSRTVNEGAGLEDVDSAEEARRAIENLPEAASAVITIGPLPRIVANRGNMRQLFQNLVGNAVKFRGEGQPRVSVTAERKGRGWLFSVADNGIGVPSEYAERIFVIFQRLHTQDKYPGTGIGLAICKKIVETHGGKIWVEKNPDGGALFRFTWPDAPSAGGVARLD